MLDYTKMNSLIDSLRTNVQKLRETFEVDTVLRLWLLTMASLAGCGCVNDAAGKEERERLIREYQNAEADLKATLQSIASLRRELDDFYYQHDGFVTENPIWFFTDAPDDYWEKRCVSSVDDRLDSDFADVCIGLGILYLRSEHGGTCGSAEYSLSYVYDLLGNLYGLMRSYETLDKIVASCRNPSSTDCECYEFSITSSIKAEQQSILKQLDALQNGLNEAAERAELYRQKAYAALAG